MVDEPLHGSRVCGWPGKYMNFLQP
jgi:hypothetical protein